MHHRPYDEDDKDDDKSHNSFELGLTSFGILPCKNAIKSESENFLNLFLWYVCTDTQGHNGKNNLKYNIMST